MKPTLDPFITKRDAQLLRALARGAAHHESTEELLDRLDEINVVDHLPGLRVGLGSVVNYIDRTSGRSRSVTVTLPDRAKFHAGAVSVLSPVGCALLGRGPGDWVDVPLPDGKVLELVLAEVVNEEEIEGAER